MVRSSANSIRASHRGDFDRARELLDEVAAAAREVAELRTSQPAVYYAGYVEDANKEYVEASVVLAQQDAEPRPADAPASGPSPARAAWLGAVLVAALFAVALLVLRRRRTTT